MSKGAAYRLQADEYSCPFCALDHAKEAAKLDDLHEKLRAVPVAEPKTKIQKVDWQDLPPTLVKNSQSSVYLREYIRNNV